MIMVYFLMCFLFIQDNTTALHIAASKGDTDIVRLLISCSIDPNIQTEVSSENLI